MAPGRDIDLSEKIKDFAYSIGFGLIGVAPAKQLTDHKKVLDDWLSAGMNADMTYLSNEIEKRINPSLLFDGARSVIVAGLSYFPSEKQGGNGIPVISKYAYGKDYHVVVRKKLNELLNYIISCEPGASGKICVDSSPVLEKAWAHEAGLGWIGRNSLLLNNEKGSFLFLGEIILNIDLQYDKPFSEDLCRTCTLCMEACPTNAINENRTINARRCISWLTLESNNPVPGELINKLDNRIFGCDICQDVCPWNKNVIPHKNQELVLPEELKQMTSEDWLNLTKEKFNSLFNSSAIRRRTYEKFMGNVTNVTKLRN